MCQQVTIRLNTLTRWSVLDMEERSTSLWCPLAASSFQAQFDHVPCLGLANWAILLCSFCSFSHNSATSPYPPFHHVTFTHHYLKVKFHIYHSVSLFIKYLIYLLNYASILKIRVLFLLLLCSSHKFHRLYLQVLHHPFSFKIFFIVCLSRGWRLFFSRHVHIMFPAKSLFPLLFIRFSLMQTKLIS